MFSSILKFTLLYSTHLFTYLIIQVLLISHICTRYCDETMEAGYFSRSRARLQNTHAIYNKTKERKRKNKVSHVDIGVFNFCFKVLL